VFLLKSGKQTFQRTSVQSNHHNAQLAQPHSDSALEVNASVRLRDHARPEPTQPHRNATFTTVILQSDLEREQTRATQDLQSFWRPPGHHSLDHPPHSLPLSQSSAAHSLRWLCGPTYLSSSQQGLKKKQKSTVRLKQVGITHRRTCVSSLASQGAKAAHSQSKL
jgi:hypothetical protein